MHISKLYSYQIILNTDNHITWYVGHRNCGALCVIKANTILKKVGFTLIGQSVVQTVNTHTHMRYKWEHTRTTRTHKDMGLRDFM